MDKNVIQNHREKWQDEMMSSKLVLDIEQAPIFNKLQSFCRFEWFYLAKMGMVG